MKINESEIIIFNTLAYKCSRYESESKISSMLRNVTLFSNKPKWLLLLCSIPPEWQEFNYSHLDFKHFLESWPVSKILEDN